MGGYAGYVWGAVGLTLVVLVWNWLAAKARFARMVTKARRRITTVKGETK